MISVLFVCLGNICRSPMAEAIFRDLAAKKGLEEKIKADSAGIGGWHIGNPPHEGTQEILRREGISFDGMLARQSANRIWPILITSLQWMQKISEVSEAWRDLKTPHISKGFWTMLKIQILPTFPILTTQGILKKSAN